MFVPPRVEFAPTPSDAEKWALTARPVGQTALYLYPGEPTEVTFRPYRDLLDALDAVSQDGDTSKIQPLLGPDGEGLLGMHNEFARRGVEIGYPRTLPQMFALAVSAGDLPLHRPKWSQRLFNPRQLHILDYGVLGFKNGEIAGLVGMTEEEYRQELMRMGEQADCEPGLLRLLRKASQQQARSVELSLPPHDPAVKLTPKQLKIVESRAQSKSNREIAADTGRSPQYQDNLSSKIKRMLEAGTYSEVIAKAVLLGDLRITTREPEGLPLSDQQVAVLVLSARGYSAPQIDELIGAGNTAESHLVRARDKLGASSYEEAVLRAFEDGTLVAVPAGGTDSSNA